MYKFMLLAILIGFSHAIDFDEDETINNDVVKNDLMAINNIGEEVSLNNVDSIPRQYALESLHLDTINCEQFPEYAMNCTERAAMMYNSSRKAPPLPIKMHDWCGAIKYLSDCALEWNYQCRDVTDSFFNEESIKGHSHVVKNICQNEEYITKYDRLTSCIDNISDSWELCYTTFKIYVDERKNSTKEWTHYDTHFTLCCARAHFRRCTLGVLFKSKICAKHEALALQKFSIIVSEGDVYQDCDSNVLYVNCPGGDPRPSANELAEYYDYVPLSEKGTTARACLVLIAIFLFITSFVR